MGTALEGYRGGANSGGCAPGEGAAPRHQALLLAEALPFIQQNRGKTLVIKYGGHAMREEPLRQAFARDVVLLKSLGIHVIIVHSGGPQIDDTMRRLGLATRFGAGVRGADSATGDVVEMVLGGTLNLALVTVLNRSGGQAVGLTGKDAQLLVTTPKRLYQQGAPGVPPEGIPLGHVGEITAVNTALLTLLATHGFIPVIAPIGGAHDGQSYNVNADTAAGAIAAALQAEQLVILTNVEGIRTRDGALYPRLHGAAIEALKQEGLIDGGMGPKVDACLYALQHGVSRTRVIDGRVPHALGLTVLTDVNTGTAILP